MKRTFIDTDNLIKDYLAGTAISKLCVKYHSHFDKINNILREKGIKRERPIHTVDKKAIIDLFNQGIGVRGIAKRLEIKTASTVKLILLQNGLKPRNCHEQQLVRMQNASPEERAKLTKKAHDTVRGRKKSFEEKEKHALAIFKKGTPNISKYETMLFDILRNKGLNPIQQFPLGIYNCDFAFPSVIVEIFGGHWHWSGTHLAIIEERTRYILNSGYHLLMFAVNNISPFSERIADYIVSFLNFASTNPTATREYRMIWRAGEIVTSGTLNDNHISIEYPFTIRRNPTNGQYESIPKNAINM